MADQDYFNDSSQWGDHQYVTLKQIINDIMANRDSDSYLFNTPRHTMLYHAKRGIRELYYDVMHEVKAIELDIGPTLKAVFPPDYVNYVRISWVDDNGILHPMAEDKRMSIASAYLQDHEYKLLFDHDGCVLEGDGKRDNNINPTGGDSDSDALSYLFSYGQLNSFTPNSDLSNSFPNGRYRIDKQSGYIEFGSNTFSKSIVLEYISDGLYTSTCNGSEEDIRVHKFVEEVLIDYINYSVVKNKRNVTGSARYDFRKDYYNSKRRSKRRLNTLRKDELLQTFKGASAWIKGLR
jgi:hypothetical protein